MIANSDGSPEIVASGVAPYSDKAIEDIQAALSQAGINDEISIPDGCWNIVWMVVNGSITGSEDVAFKMSKTGSAYSTHKASEYDDYSTYTANGHVFWIAKETGSGVPEIFKCTTKTFFQGNGPAPVFFAFGDATKGPITTSIVQFNKGDDYTYLSSKSSNFCLYNSIPFIVLGPNYTIVPKDYIQATKVGQEFDGYSCATSNLASYFSEETQTITNLPGGKTLKLDPQFSELTGQSITVIETTDDGTVDVPSSAATGVTVTVKVTPNAGYVVTSVTATHGGATPLDLTPVAGAENEWTFIMPDDEVTITVTYEQAYAVTIIIDGNVGGSATATPSENVRAGADVQLKISPADGYVIESVTATYNDNTSADVNGDGDTRSFVMPAGNVTVTVKFKQVTYYNVTIQSLENGTIIAEPARAYEGQTVTLKIQPNKGYELEAIYIRVNDTRDVDYKSGGITQITFVMPGNDVTVHATFKKAAYKTIVGVATLWDRPGTSSVLYKGHYDDSDSDGDNKMVGEYSISEPTDKGDHLEYTVTARDLHMFASVDKYHVNRGEAEPVSAAFGYYIGLTLVPGDGGSQSYSSVSYSKAPAESREALSGAETTTAKWSSNEAVPITVYFELDPDEPNREYWISVLWENKLGSKTEYICVKVDADFLPITHTYQVPDKIPGGFSGQTSKQTSLGVVNDNGFNDGYKDIRTPEQLGWSIPATWEWHWVIDGNTENESKWDKSDNFVNDLTQFEDSSSMSHYYDHTFKLVFSRIPTNTVTVTPPANGSVTLTPAAEKNDNKYNFGQTVTVTVKPNEGYDLSKLTVGGEDVSAKVYNKEYSFVVAGDTTISAEFISADSKVTGVTVNGLTASHTGDKAWSIVLPWNSTLPTDGSSNIRFTFASSGTATFKSSTADGDKSKTYTYEIDSQTYTVKVTIAERRDFKLTVDLKNGGFDPIKGITVDGDSATVSESAQIELTLKPGFGYALPDTIRVTVGNVLVAPKDYSYNRNTGKVTIPGAKVTGDVVITVGSVYGSVHVEIRAGHEDIYAVGYDFVTQENTQTYDPVYSTDLPRSGDFDYNIQQTNLATAANMIPNDSQSSSSGQSGNSYQWVIPKWLTFKGWWVNQDAQGNHVDDPDQYTQLTETATDGSYPYKPNSKNPTPIIEARWEELPTYTLKVTLMPGAEDVVYDGPVDNPPPADLWHQTVTAENAMTVTGKAAQEDTLKVYIPETFYTRKGFHFNRWVDNMGTPIEMSDDGAIQVTYDGNAASEMVIYADWTREDTGYSIPAVFQPGEHGIGDDYIDSLTYTIDKSGAYTPETIMLPDADECDIEPEEGWKFTGWKIDGDSTFYNGSVNTSEFVGKYGDGVTFIAQWEWVGFSDIPYTVSPGSGSGVSGSEVSKVLSKDATERTITLPTTIAGIKAEFTGWTIPDNVEFLGWTFGTDLIVNEEKGVGRTEAFRPTEGMTITATWAAKDKVETWELEYDANGGNDEGENSMPALIHRVDSDDGQAQWRIEVEECTFEPPVGQQFNYWTINGRRVSVNEVVTIRESDLKDGKITIRAVWKDIPDTVVKVYFRDGGGTGFMQSAEVKIAWNEASRTFTFPTCDYTGTSANPTFAGWKYTVKGVRKGTTFSESDGQIYQPGHQITVNQVTADETIISIELVAQWKPQSSGTGGGGSGFGGGTGAGAGTGAGTGTGTSTGNNPVITPEPSEQPSNGKVDSNVHSANTGDTVTVLPTPDSRHMTGKVVVKDKDGNEVDVTWNGDGTYSFEMPEGGVTVTAEFVTPDEVYEDVEADDWYLADVANAANYGLMTGVSATDFGPDETATRAQMMTILARRNNVPGTWAGGADWYKAGAEWAVNEGISDGTRLFDALTREEIITMLYRYVGSPKVSGSRTATFADANTVDSWAVDAIEWAVEVGIMQGRGNNELAPRDVATRAELAAILSRVMRLVKEF